MITGKSHSMIEFLDTSGTIPIQPLLDRNGIWRFPPFDGEDTLLLRVTIICDAFQPFFVSVSHSGWTQSLMFFNHNCTQSEIRINLKNSGTIKIQIHPAIIRRWCYTRWVKGAPQDTIDYSYSHNLIEEHRH